MDTRLGSKKHAGHVPKQRLMSKLFRGMILGIFLFSTFVSPFSPLFGQPQAEARFLEMKYTPGQMQTTRKGFSAHVLKQGLFKGSVLLAGGFDGVSYLSSVERFDPVAGNYFPFVANLNTARANGASVELPDGRIVFIGGRTSESSLTNTIEIFDPADNTFHTNNGGLPTPALATAREFHTATYFTDGSGNEKILIAGGSNGTALVTSTEIFDLGNNTITAGPAMATARAKQVAYVFPNAGTDGQILFLGGTSNAASDTPITLTQSEKYDVNANTMSAAGITGAATLTAEGRLGFSHVNIDISAQQKDPRIMIAGGQRLATQVSNTAVILEHDGSNFIASAPTGSTKTFGVARRGAAGIMAFEDSLTANRKVYFLGGETASNQALYSYETYDVASDSFQTTSADALGTARAYTTTVKLPRLLADGGHGNNEQIMLFAGENQTTPIVQSSEFFDTQRFQVTPSNLLFPRSDFETVEITDNQPDGSHYINYGKQLIIGGRKDAAGADWMTNAAARFEVEIYDPQTHTFIDLCDSGRNVVTNRCNTPSKDLQFARMGLTATKLSDGRIIIAGGTNNGTEVSAVEVFNPQTNTFSTLSTSGDALAARSWHSATQLNSNEILFFGGTTGQGTSTVGQCGSYPIKHYYAPMAAPQVLNVQTGAVSSLISGNAIGSLTPRFGHAATKIGNSIYFAGGTLFLGNGGSVERLNLVDGTVSTIATGVLDNKFRLDSITYDQGGNNKLMLYGGLSQYRTSFGSFGCSGYEYYAFGGNSGLSAATTIVDLGTGAVTAGPAFTQGMEFASHVTLPDGKVLVAGSNHASANRTVFEINPQTPSITPLVGTTRAIHNAGKMFRVTPKGASQINMSKVIIAGGFDAAGALVAGADVFDPRNAAPERPTDPTIPSANQVFSTTRQPVFEFTTTDLEEDNLMYQVQIVAQTGTFPVAANDLDPSNPVGNFWNFIQRYDPSGFINQDSEDGIHYNNGSTAQFDMSLTDYTLPNGNYKLRVRAIDPLASKSYSQWGPIAGQVNFTVTAENNAPETAITLPATGGSLNIASFDPIQGTASDDTAVQKVKVAVRDTGSNKYWNGLNGFTMNNEVFFDAVGTTAWEYAGVTAWENGHTYEVKAKAIDTIGNRDATPATQTFTYDSSIVPTTVTVTSPNGGENLTIGGTHTVTWTSSAIPSVYELYYSTDNFVTQTPIDTNISGALTSYTWTVPNDASSTTKIMVVAKDAGGAIRGQDVSDGDFTVSNNGGDTVAPGVTITSPVNGSNPSSISSIMGTHDDPTAASVKVTIRDTASGNYWNGTAFAPAANEEAAKQDATGTGSPWSYATNSIPFADGQTYEFKAFVKDPAGNEGVATSTVAFGTSAGNSNDNTNTGNGNSNTSNGNTNSGTGNTNTNSGTGNSNTNGGSNGNTNSGTGNTNVNGGTNGNTNTGGSGNQNTNTGTGNTNTNNGGGNGSGGNQVVCPAGYIFFSGGCVAFNPFQPQPTQPTPAPIVITTPTPSYPSYPYPYPSQPTPNQNTSTPDTSAPLATITFPATGATPTTVSSIQGNSQDAGGSGVYYVEVELYNETTGRYFDGSAFNSTARQAFLAQGGSVWSLAVPNTAFVNGQRYAITAKAKDNAGNMQEMPSKVTITYAGTGEGEDLNPAAPAQTNVNTNAGTTPTTTENDDDLLARLDRMLASIEAMANKPVNVTVSNPNTSTPPRVVVQNPTTTTPTAPSTSTATVNNGATPTQADTGTGATYVNSNGNNSYDTYDQQYNDYISQNPDAIRNPNGYDTQGLRDTDGDGLSDYIELRLGTDPFKKDTDNDGYSDGEEVLEYGTNPLDPNSVPNLNGVGITNIDSKLLTSDKTPFITGYAKPGSQVVLYDVLPDGTKKEIGSGEADARGRYVIYPDVPLGDGKHYLATGIKDKNGDVVDMSAVKEVEVDSSLTIPVPEVEDIKITNKKPIVFGKTQYGTTVVAHFQSLVTSSSVVADTTAGDFIVTSATPLEIGNHKVTLYAMLPNGARSEEVTVPFEVTENDNDILNPAMFKADVSEAGDASIWWLLGALIPLLLLAALLVYMLLNKRDTVIYSVTPRQLGDVENTKVGTTFAYQSDLSVTKADLTTDYIAFYLLKGEENEHVNFSEFTTVKEETIGIIARIVEEKFILERETGNVEFTKESIDMDDLPKYKIHYVFEVISTEAKPMNKFIGKRYALAKDLIHDVALLEHNKAETEEEHHLDTTHKA